MLDAEDFNIGYEWKQDGDILHINHLFLDPDNRGRGWGSVILETFVRFAYYEGARVIEVSIGGGDAAADCLKRNGFHIYREREYTDWNEGPGDYGVDAVRSIRA